MGYKVAVVGATGNVGREMLNILDERKFPADEVVVLASRRSVGVEVSYGDRTLKVKALEHYDFSDVDICLMSAGGSVSKEWSPKIGAAGAVVIDNSSAWRMDPDVPLVVPEVNADAAAGFTKKNIIANPNCSTAQLVVALKPLHDKAEIKRRHQPAAVEDHAFEPVLDALELRIGPIGSRLFGHLRLSGSATRLLTPPSSWR